MMDWTDRHDRAFLRLITRHTRLYTEMVPSGAILFGDRARFLAFDAREHPVALQLGGSDPAELAACARLAAEHGYDEVNLNVGCPSGRVQKGRFGACLLAEPELVADCVAAMTRAVAIPVTVKTRIGIDDLDSFDHLKRFAAAMIDAGCHTLIVHARKAWLSGLSPKENREVPPLDYARIYRLKQAFPQFPIVLNGGVTSLDDAAGHLAHVDGVMIGRAAYQDPYCLAAADLRFFGGRHPVPSRVEIVQGIIAYAGEQRVRGVPLHAVTRHILGLFNGVPGARAWRRHLSEAARHPKAGVEVIEEALAFIRSEAARRAA